MFVLISLYLLDLIFWAELVFLNNLVLSHVRGLLSSQLVGIATSSGQVGLNAIVLCLSNEKKIQQQANVEKETK
jgi:hypothetical protein